MARKKEKEEAAGGEENMEVNRGGMGGGVYGTYGGVQLVEVG